MDRVRDRMVELVDGEEERTKEKKRRRRRRRRKGEGERAAKQEVK